jgi:hypothetical protein
MNDTTVTMALVGAFALLVTLHVAACFGLWRRHRRARALGAFFFPPLAPYWAFTEGMRARALAWIASAALYATAFALARR